MYISFALFFFKYKNSYLVKSVKLLSIYCKNGSRKKPLSVFELCNSLNSISAETLFPKQPITNNQTNSTNQDVI